MVQASSAAVYGMDANCVYSRDKMIAEWMTANAGPMQSIILRFFNVYGEKRCRTGVIHQWAEAKAREQKIRLEGNGAQTRDFIHVDDVARAVAVSALSPVDMHGEDNYTFHADVGTGREISLNQLREMMGIPESQIVRVPANDGPIFSRAEIEDMRDEFGWVAQHSLQSRIPLIQESARKRVAHAPPDPSEE